MDLLKLASLNRLATYIHGWKGLANYYGVTTRCLQMWHRELKIPWEKNSNKKPAKVKIHITLADEYHRLLRGVRNLQTKDKKRRSG